jgi:nitrogen fixation protein FixH
VTAYLTAFFAGQITGLAFWLTLLGLGLMFATVFAVALTVLADWTVRHWPGDLDCNDYCGSPRGDE